MQKITPFLWFNRNAEEAANFYISTFKNSEMIYAGKTTVSFEIFGKEFILLNGGPYFKFNPSISFLVSFKKKEELEKVYHKLVEGGSVIMPLEKYDFSEEYTWINDKYGVSWQLILVPENAEEKIVPSLMFTGERCGMAEEAMNFYLKAFNPSKIGFLARYPGGADPDKEGSIMHATFDILGQTFAAMDSAREHNFNFNEAVSFTVNCKDQEEVDYYWEKLSADPKSERCGWLKDRYGISWQVVPIILGELLAKNEPEKTERMMKSVLKMKKLIAKEIQDAYEGK